MGKLPSEIWIPLLFVFWRLLSCCCFFMIALPFPVCLRSCTSLVPCRQSHHSVRRSLQPCAACSLLDPNKQSLCALMTEPSGMLVKQGAALALLSCSDLKNSFPFGRFQKDTIQIILLGERQNSGLFSLFMPGHIWSSFALQAHSWAFSSPCPKPRTSIHSAGISKTTLSCFWLQPWMRCLVEQSSLCKLACRSLGSGSVLLPCMSSQN